MCLDFFSVFVVFCVLKSSSGVSVEEQWNEFKSDYKQIYEHSEELHAFEVFKNNLQDIETHNKLYEQGLVTYKKRITKFADLTGEEFTKKYSLHQGRLRHYNNPFNQTSNSTGYLNWKEKGAVAKVKDQGVCGACWIFAAVGVIEGFYFRKNNKSITLSEQNIIDCFESETCRGGLPSYVMEYLQKEQNGINTAEDYPHKGLRGTCRYDKTKKVKLDFHNYTDDFVRSSQKDLKLYLEKYGPIAIAISANEHWRLYDSGIWFEEKCSKQANHAVLLVGYGTENGKDYWLIKNSYGKDWGLNGYIKIARNINRSYCGISRVLIIYD